MATPQEIGNAGDVLAMAKTNVGIFEDIVWVIADAASSALGVSNDVGRPFMAFLLTGFVIVVARFLFLPSWVQADEQKSSKEAVVVSTSEEDLRYDPLSPKPLRSLGGHMARIRSRIIMGGKRDMNGSGPGTQRNFSRLSGQIDQTMYAARRRYHELMNTFGMQAAVKKYNERKLYRQVTQNSEKGDGLKSLFTSVQAPAHADAAKLSVSPSSQAFGQFHQFPQDFDLLEALHATEIFSWLPERNIRTLGEKVSRSSFSEDEVVFDKGWKVDTPCCFVVVSGKVGLMLDVDASGAAINIQQQPDSRPGTPSSARVDSEKDHDMIVFEHGEMVTGLTDLIATVMEEPLRSLARAVALEDNTVIAKVSTASLNSLFEENPIVKQQLLQRILIRINRVSFTSLFRLTGRFVLGSPGCDGASAQPVRPSTPGDSQGMEALALRYLAAELGLPISQLADKLDVVEWEWESEGATSVEAVHTLDLNDFAADGQSLRARSSSMGRSGSVQLESAPRVEPAREVSSQTLQAQLVVLNNGDDILQVSAEPSMYIVLAGRLDVYLGSPGNAEGSSLQHSIHPGQALGHLSLLSGSWSEWYARRKTYKGTKGDQGDQVNQLWVAAGGVEEAGGGKEDPLHGSSSFRSFNGKGLRRTGSDWRANLRKGSIGSVTSASPWNAQSTTTLLRVPQAIYFALVREFPDIVSHKSKSLLSQISPLVRLMDATTKWVRLQPGDTLLREGQRTNQVHVVLHGRLRSTIRPPRTEKHGTRVRKGSVASGSSGPGSSGTRLLNKSVSENGWGWSYATSDTGLESNTTSEEDPEDSLRMETTVDEFGRGSTIGQLSFLTGKCMSVNIRAVRSTQLASIPRASLMAVIAHHPEILLRLTKDLAARSEARQVPNSKAHQSLECRTVAMVPASPTVPLDLFANTLAAAMRSMSSSVFVVTSAKVEQVAARRILSLGGTEGEDAADSNYVHDLVVSTWLNELEDTYDVVLYQADPWADPSPSRWTQLCVMEADTVLLVGNASDHPRCSALEVKLNQLYTNAQRELVLLHINPSDQGARENALPLPTSTRAWIENRGNIHHHHHVRFHPYDQSSLQGRDQGLYDVHHFKSDFRRLGRWLTGTSVGLVLGGGGAKGCAHLGVLRALENQGIPVDFVAGTSIGAFMGGLYALKTDQLLMRQLVSRFCGDMSSVWKKIKSLTLPLTAYFTGKAFNRTIVKVFENQKIEDCWLPFFCVTTDLTDSKELAHRNGAMWRYVRASMSLTGYLPPVCDVVQGADGKKQVHYICDGGYINNLPVDIMREMLGPDATVIAVDVQAEWDFSGDDYGDSLNGWKTLFTWLNPWGETRKVPFANDIQVQLAYISSVKQSLLNPPKKLANLLINPPVGHFGTLEFNKHKEIESLGYEAAVKSIHEWKQDLKEVLDDRLRQWATSVPRQTQQKIGKAFENPATVFAALEKPSNLMRSSSSFYG